MNTALSKIISIVGIDGLKKALAQLPKPDTYFAASLSDAKDQLVAHAP